MVLKQISLLASITWGLAFSATGQTLPTLPSNPKTVRSKPKATVQVKKEKKDSDGDGLIDNRDNCPNDYGPLANGGCPEVQAPPTSKMDFEPEMVVLVGGKFNMGSNVGQTYEKPVHHVTLKGFAIGKYEITQSQWLALMKNNPSKHRDCDNCPVENVNLDDIQIYLQKLNSLTGKEYRLPTEAEWEYAARGGANGYGHIYAGGDDIGAVAWYTGNSHGQTHPVGQKQPNELHIYDMTGNVEELCPDRSDDYTRTSQTNPKGPASGEFRVKRGGCMINDPFNCRVTGRYSVRPDDRNSGLGFRVALSLY